MTRVPGRRAVETTAFEPLEPPQPMHEATAAAAAQLGGTDWIGLGEASRMLGISHGTLRRWADEGRVAVFTTPGGHRRFSRSLVQALLPAGRSRRPSLARLGASAERIARDYRPERFRVPSRQPWLERLSEPDQDAFRAGGRAIVTALLEHLDATDDDAAATGLQEACRLAAEHGRRVAQLGASMTEAVTTFLDFRAPFLGALAEIARRRGLDTREATELLAQAEAAMDRLLVATMTGYSVAAGSSGTGPAGTRPRTRQRREAPAR